jgi:hypothetical protein
MMTRLEDEEVESLFRLPSGTRRNLDSSRGREKFLVWLALLFCVLFFGVIGNENFSFLLAIFFHLAQSSCCCVMGEHDDEAHDGEILSPTLRLVLLCSSTRSYVC